MTYLVDANILSEPTRLAPNVRVVHWLRANEAELAVDAVILGEVWAGIFALARGRKRNQLQQWFDSVVAAIECLPWDAAIATRWAKLIVDLKAKGRKLPIVDSMVAATALAYDLTLATHKVRHFQAAGVKVIDPFSASG